jgi:hypothetical protein
VSEQLAPRLRVRSRSPLYAAGVQYNQSLELLVFKIDGTAAIGAEPPFQFVAARGVVVFVGLNHVRARGEGDLGTCETVIVCERGARGFLAIAAMAEYCAFVVACDAVLYGLAEA